MTRGRRHAEGSGLSTWGNVRRGGRRLLAIGVRSFAENDLLSYASAIAFQVLFALIPLALAGLAFLGFLNLEDVWESDLGPRVRERVRDDAFSVIDRTVEQVVGEKRGLWLTFGIALAVWQVSGAVRATYGPLNVIYGAEEERSFLRRLLVSIALALAIAPLVVGAALVVQLGPRLVGAVGLPAPVGYAASVLRWAAAVALLAGAVWLLIRFAPATRQSFAWAGLGSVFVVVAWIAASLAFGFYATAIADYGSVFGSLASLIVFLTYIYVSSAALMFGVQLDACVREQVEDGPPSR